jgi:UDP-N-acetyl-D-mannosaminuronic acid dehydrogenase
LVEELIKMINQKEAKIAIIGLGYVGLPTAALFANLGFRVTGIDVNSNIVSKINHGKVHTEETGLQEIVAKVRQRGYLSATETYAAINEANIVIISVQTPLDNRGNPNLSFLEAACQTIADNMGQNKLIIIQSTVPPKTIETLIIPTLEKRSKLKCGKDFWLIFCPERMSPGNGLNDLTENSRLIGAYDPASATLGRTLFQLVTKGQLLITDIPSAEMAKLAENTFRYVNIAFANELSLLCKQIGVDVLEVIRLANTHPRVNIHIPGSGAGGPCLSKDTHLLLNSTKSGNFRSKVISAAIKINNYMPKHIAELALDALNGTGKDVKGSKIAVLGTAYKADTNDSRDSPSKGIVRELRRNGAKIVVFDPNCEASFGETKAKNLDEALNKADCMIIAVDHKVFRKLDLYTIKSLMKENPIIVDVKRIIDPTEARKLGFKYSAPSWPSDDKRCC